MPHKKSLEENNLKLIVNNNILLGLFLKRCFANLFKNGLKMMKL